METVEAIALMLGASWASGINLYAAILALGWLGSTGQADLPPQLEVLSNPMVMVAAGFMYCVEFFADKTPGVDTAWDTLHTFIRIPAGAIMAAAVAEGMDVGQGAELAALILGGSLAATSHATKAGTRLLINTSPEPFSNWVASITEDIAVVGAMWAALNHPILLLVALAAFIALVIWLLPKIWRALKRIARAIGHWFKPSPTGQPQAASGAPPASKRQRLLQELYDDANKGPQ
jgi:hypothetical protein